MYRTSIQRPFAQVNLSEGHGFTVIEFRNESPIGMDDTMLIYSSTFVVSSSAVCAYSPGLVCPKCDVEASTRRCRRLRRRRRREKKQNFKAICPDTE